MCLFFQKETEGYGGEKPPIYFKAPERVNFGKAERGETTSGGSLEGTRVTFLLKKKSNQKKTILNKKFFVKVFAELFPKSDRGSRGEQPPIYFKAPERGDAAFVKQMRNLR